MHYTHAILRQATRNWLISITRHLLDQCTFDVADNYLEPVTRDLVGHPGLDPGTLRVFPERPGTSLSVQICWPDEVQCPPTSADVLSRLNSWLDNWLDLGSFQGQVTIQYRGADGEELDLCMGGERRTTDPLHANATLFTSLTSAGDCRRFDYWAFNLPASERDRQ